MSQHAGHPNPCILGRSRSLDWLVVAIRVENDFPHEFAFGRDDVDVVIDDVEQDRLALVFPSDVEVTQLTEIATVTCPRLSTVSRRMR